MKTVTLGAGEVRAGAWRAPLLALAAVVVALLLLLPRDAGDMVRLWWTSSTYEHCLLIGPIAGWLVWVRRNEVARLSPAGWAPGLLVVAVGALVWLVGWAGGAAIMRQGGLVVAALGTAVACLGPAVARGLALPFGYLLFLVPFGEAFEQPLQLVTARASAVLLTLVGIANVNDGVFIRTDAGLFEVAEACAGVKFLVAMIALGVLIAGVGFRSWPRRAALMLAAVALPIAANVVRAAGTIVAAAWIGADRAGGVDHLVYGWIFFGLVIALLLGLAWPWFDRPAGASWVDVERLERITFRRRSPALIGALAVVIVGATVAWAQADAKVSTVARAFVPPAVLGWQRATGGTRDWAPRFMGADAVLRTTYFGARSARVELDLVTFADQRPGRSALGYGQGATPPGSGWTWLSGEAPIGPAAVSRIVGPGDRVRVVAALYAIEGKATASSLHLKLETLRRNLLRQQSRTAVILVSAAEPEGGRAEIERFARAVDLASLAARASGG